MSQSSNSSLASSCTFVFSDYEGRIARECVPRLSPSSSLSDVRLPSALSVPRPKSARSSVRRQAIFWILTIPQKDFTPYLPPGCSWIKGQLELSESGFNHWQVVVSFSKKRSLAGVREIFGPVHAELTRSAAANDYVWKEETSVAGTRFEFGAKPICRNSSTDWEEVWENAKSGLLARIPPHARVVSYRAIKQIALDHSTPEPMERFCKVFYGPTATGKSRTAWAEAGLQAFIKNPRTKFWCGYQGEVHVIMDEFRGAIDVSHLLLWLDRYPLRLETKGGGTVAKFTHMWITSNLHPTDWYPGLDEPTLAALLRRLEIVHFDKL